MPGFTIHVAIANEYMRKYSKEIKDKEAFIKGTIAPDLNDNKYESHYGNRAENHVGLSNFIKQTEIDMNSDYGKGYFLHLLADELFYYKELNEKPELLTYRRIKKFIHKLSNISIEKQINEINKNGNPIY